MTRRTDTDPPGEFAYSTIGFTAAELWIIHRTMEFLQVRKGVAVRYLVRAGGGDAEAERILARVREAYRLQHEDTGNQ